MGDAKTRQIYTFNCKARIVKKIKAHDTGTGRGKNIKRVVFKTLTDY